MKRIILEYISFSLAISSGIMFDLINPEMAMEMEIMLQGNQYAHRRENSISLHQKKFPSFLQ